MTLPVKGLSFLGNSGNSPDDKRHLNIILSDGDGNGNCLVVSLTTWREGKDGKPFRGQDNSCVLDVGDHPFIKHKSWIYYAMARELPCNEIFNEIIISKKFERKEVFNPSVLLKIQEGARKSKFLPEELKQFFIYF